MNTLTKNELRLAKKRYNDQRAYCRGRIDKLGNPIEFRLTFDQWLNIWLSSGHYHERGSRRAQYVMSRYNDLGHYEVGNVAIKTSCENHQENKSSDHWKAKNSERFNSPEFQSNHKAAMEKVFESQEWQDRNLAATRLANSKPISCNGQVYASLKEASELAPTNVKDKRYWLNTQIKKYPELYYYV